MYRPHDSKPKIYQKEPQCSATQNDKRVTSLMADQVLSNWKIILIRLKEVVIVLAVTDVLLLLLLLCPRQERGMTAS